MPTSARMVCPALGGVRLLDSGAALTRGGQHGQARVSPEFRGKVVDLVEAGRLVAEVAPDLEISEQHFLWPAVNPTGPTTPSWL